MKKEVMEEIQVAWNKAEKDENPPADELLAFVYKSNGFNL
jgi:TPP-dependent pyruvate/acetoin dehydrogenase alpha subunit